MPTDTQVDTWVGNHACLASPVPAPPVVSLSACVRAYSRHKTWLPHLPDACDRSQCPTSLQGRVRLYMWAMITATRTGPLSLLNECHDGVSSPRGGSCRCCVVLLAEYLLYRHHILGHLLPVQLLHHGEWLLPPPFRKSPTQSPPCIHWDHHSADRAISQAGAWSSAALVSPQ